MFASLLLFCLFVGFVCFCLFLFSIYFGFGGLFVWVCCCCCDGCFINSVSLLHTPVEKTMFRHDFKNTLFFRFEKVLSSLIGNPH